MNDNLNQFGVTFSKLKLASNIPTYLFQRAGMPICMRAVFFAGSRFDEIPGTAHFLEHILVSGSKKFPTKNQLTAFVEEMGGFIGASTDNYSLRLEVIIPKKDDFKIGLEALEEALFNSLFDPATIELERKVILTEIAKRRNNPQTRLFDMYKQFFFQDKKLAQPVIGDESSILKITRKDLLDFKNKFVVPERMCLILSGDINSNEAESYLNEYFLNKNLNIVESEIETPPLLPFIQNTKTLIEKLNNEKQGHITLGFRTCPFHDKDTAILEVITSILGGGKSSRLINELRYKNGLVYNVSAMNSHLPDVGTFTVSTSCSESSVEKVIKIIVDEFEKIKTKSLGLDELKSVKSRLIKSQFIKMQTSQSWVQLHEKELLFNGNHPKLITDYLKEIDSVNITDIEEVAKKYFDRDKIFTVLYGTGSVEQVDNTKTSLNKF